MKDSGEQELDYVTYKEPGRWAAAAMLSKDQARRTATNVAWSRRPLWKHEHFAVADLIFRKNVRTGFRVYLNFRVGKACFDCSDSLDFVGNGNKK